MSWGNGVGEYRTYLACCPRKDCQVSICLSGSMRFVHEWGRHRSKACRTDETPCFRAANCCGAPRSAVCLMSEVVFSFLLSLSNVWNFDDGNVILRAIFKILRNWLIVLRMNSASIKFTLNVAFKNLNRSLHCKESRPHGITYEMVEW